MEDDDFPPDAVAIDAPKKGEDPAILESKHVPVTLITGFLGAGKTTLVRHILTDHHGLRVAVIMNEYGESVEGSYFTTPEGTRANLGEWVDLANGCMCCAVKSEFVQAIESLMTKRANFDHILIETTGLADPGPIAAALWTDDQLEAGVQLDSIIAVVDALNINRQLHDPRPEGAVNEAQVQLAYADLILLNKMDMSGEEAVVRAEADIRAVNSSVQIIRTHHCSVDLAVILNRNGYSPGADVLQTITETDDTEEKEEKCDEHAEHAVDEPEVELEDEPGLCSDSLTSNGLGGSARPLSRSASKVRRKSGRLTNHEDHRQHHDRRIQTTSLRTSQPVDLEKFRSFMDRLLWDRDVHPEDIYRVKGQINVAGSNQKHVLQAVYELYNIVPTIEWRGEEVRQTVVVVIGRNLKREKMNEWFQACLVPDASVGS